MISGWDVYQSWLAVSSSLLGSLPYLGRPSSKPVQHTRPHIAPVRLCGRAPDVADDANERREDEDGSAAECRLDGDPKRISDFLLMEEKG
jgi:hypothetical protein